MEMNAKVCLVGTAHLLNEFLGFDAWNTILILCEIASQVECNWPCALELEFAFVSEFV